MNVMLNLFQHRISERPCDPEASSGRRAGLCIFVIMAITCSTLVFTGVECFAADTVPAVQTTSTEKQSKVGIPAHQSNDVKQSATIPEKNAYAAEHMEKTGFKYAFLKFLMAMLGVLVSALAIFAGLKFYKNFVLKNDAKQGNIDFDKTLESPKNFKEAINLFLNKTNKR
jgi:hypothetical protein